MSGSAQDLCIGLDFMLFCYASFDRNDTHGCYHLDSRRLPIGQFRKTINFILCYKIIQNQLVLDDAVVTFRNF